MANTIAGVNLAEIAQESLPALQSLFAPLNAISTDFSSDISQRGESVTTRIPTEVTAQDLSSGYTASDVGMTAKTINLDTFSGFVYAFNDVERSKSAINLGNLFLEPASNALATKVFGDLWNLITKANFADTEVVDTDLTRDDLVSLGSTLSANKIPTTNRFALLNNAQYGNVMKSIGGSADLLGQQASYQERALPKIAGFDLYESNLCDVNDNSGGSGINENLTGFAGHKSALLFAGRAVDSEGAEQAGVEVENVVIPEIGLPVQFRRFYNPASGTLNFSMGILYGVSVGTGKGTRIVSGATA